MHPDTLERFAREHMQALLDEVEVWRRVPLRHQALRPRVARWLRVLAGRLDRTDPTPADAVRPSTPCPPG